MSTALTVRDLQLLASKDGNMTNGWTVTQSKAKEGKPSRPLRLAIQSKKTWVASHHEDALKKDPNATKSQSEKAFKIMRSDRARELTEQIGARMLSGKVQISGASFNKDGVVSGFKVDTPDTARQDLQNRALKDVTPEEAKALMERLAKIAATPIPSDAIDTSATPVADGVPEAVGAASQ